MYQRSGLGNEIFKAYNSSGKHQQVTLFRIKSANKSSQNIRQNSLKAIITLHKSCKNNNMIALLIKEKCQQAALLVNGEGPLARWYKSIFTKNSLIQTQQFYQIQFQALYLHLRTKLIANYYLLKQCSLLIVVFWQHVRKTGCTMHFGYDYVLLACSVSTKIRLLRNKLFLCSPIYQDTHKISIASHAKQ